MQACNLLVELLRQTGYAHNGILTILPQLHLCESLVGERVTHHERGVARSATQVHKTTLGQNEDRVAIGEGVFINLRLDSRFHSVRGLQACHLDLVVEVADVADDSLVAHTLHMLQGDDVAVTRRGYVDVTLGQSVLDAHNLEALHCSLQSADGVDLGYDHAGTIRAHRACAALAHVAIAADNHNLASDHHVRCTLDTVSQRLAATIQVVELRLCNRVIYVDCGYEQLATLLHLVEAVNTRSGLLRNALPLLDGAVPLLGILLQELTQRCDDHALLVAAGLAVERRCVVLGCETLVDQQRCVATVINDQIGTLATLERERHCGTPPILFERLALPSKYGNTCLGNCCCGVVLRREDVARAPTYLGAQLNECFDQYGGLNCHMERAHNTCAFERLLLAVLAAQSHQTGHFVLRNFDLFASPLSQRDVRNAVGNSSVDEHSV